MGPQAAIGQCFRLAPRLTKVFRPCDLEFFNRIGRMPPFRGSKLPQPSAQIHPTGRGSAPKGLRNSRALRFLGATFEVMRYGLAAALLFLALATSVANQTLPW
jgi:hypothetical protein